MEHRTLNLPFSSETRFAKYINPYIKQESPTSTRFPCVGRGKEIAKKPKSLFVNNSGVDFCSPFNSATKFLKMEKTLKHHPILFPLHYPKRKGNKKSSNTEQLELHFFHPTNINGECRELVHF
ncbi:unnamed protein product [Orchesella dallaii]|uniref:Uncharacterized protein n=1 Tax=Orchesella dallaii TaxID=48710 RepID=A0ABP1PR51_9HEXA